MAIYKRTTDKKAARAERLFLIESTMKCYKLSFGESAGRVDKMLGSTLLDGIDDLSATFCKRVDLFLSIPMSAHDEVPIDTFINQIKINIPCPCSN